MMKCLYLHGGPGFSSRPEEAKLGPALTRLGLDCYFWNEPSIFRPKGFRFSRESAFINQINSIENFVKNKYSPHIVLAHSYAMYPALMAIDKGHLRPAGLVLFSPVFDIHEAHRRILRLAAADFQKNYPEKASRLESILQLPTDFFDESIEEGLKIAMDDQCLLDHYWVDKTIMHEILPFMLEPSFQFDAENFFCVLRDLRLHLDAILATEPRSIPTLVVYGKQDPVAVKESDQSLAKSFCHSATICELDGGHWIHLENQDATLRILAQFLTQLADK